MDNHRELKVLHEAMFGTELEEVRNGLSILKLLRDGKSDIIMNLKWGEKYGGQYYEEHKIVIQKVTEDNRVIFFNPLGHSNDMKKGTIIQGKDMGPARIVEDIGLESISIEDFLKFFTERNAICFLPKNNIV